MLKEIRDFIYRLRNRKAIIHTQVVIEPSPVRVGREYIVFPDGLRIIVEDGEYVGFCTCNPCDR